jgi:hypothetical protein
MAKQPPIAVRRALVEMAEDFRLSAVDASWMAVNLKKQGQETLSVGFARRASTYFEAAEKLARTAHPNQLLRGSYYLNDSFLAQLGYGDGTAYPALQRKAEGIAAMIPADAGMGLGNAYIKGRF